jgi:hypothetical protein
MSISSSNFDFVTSNDPRSCSRVGCPFLGFFLDVSGSAFLSDVNSSRSEPCYNIVSFFPFAVNAFVTPSFSQNPRDDFEEFSSIHNREEKP